MAKTSLNRSHFPTKVKSGEEWWRVPINSSPTQPTVAQQVTYKMWRVKSKIETGSYTPNILLFSIPRHTLYFSSRHIKKYLGTAIYCPRRGNKLPYRGTFRNIVLYSAKVRAEYNITQYEYNITQSDFYNSQYYCIIIAYHPTISVFRISPYTTVASHSPGSAKPHKRPVLRQQADWGK